MNGRNGYCSLGKAEFISLPKTKDEAERNYVDFYSKRGSDKPPARLILDTADFAAFKAWVAGLEAL